MRQISFVIVFVLMLVFNKLGGLESSVTIGFVGDIMLGRTVSDLLLRIKDYAYPWGTLLPLLNGTDFVIGNLETAFTRNGIKTPKVFNFRSDPSNVEALKRAKIHAVNIANNHILDFGLQGLIDSLATLNNAQIAHAGAGLNLEQAQQPAFLTKNGIKFGIIGFTDNEPDWAAAENKPGVNYIKIDNQAINKVRSLVVSAKQKVDVLIVSLHWGFNWTEIPPLEFQKFAHDLIDAGADIIHGHSAHIVQPIEIYKNRLIMYGTGDFLDDYAVDLVRRNDQSFLFLVKINKNKIEQIKLIPTEITTMQVNLAKDPKKSISHMQEISRQFGTTITAAGIVVQKMKSE
jgi:poly-gamma-glutamate capsule biosynthesis protein CapA/YwtB (metallophosphatase superfamily)